MGFFKRLSGLFKTSSAKTDDASYWISVRCKRCGETIRARVDLRNDLSLNYNEDGGDNTYFCRKTIMGEDRCFQRIEVELTFNTKRQLLDRQIQGGDFVDE